jgi:DNA polymerase III delta prime subunit
MQTTAIVQQSIRQEISNANLSHAYLISGGKNCVREVVRNTVKALQKDKIDPIDNIECLDDGKKFGVKELRETQNQMMLTSHSKYKTCYIENIERLSIPAVNSMLKILEEPPEGVVFFLGCQNKNNVLDTIISRCRGYEIKNKETQDFGATDEVMSGLQNDSDAIAYAAELEDRNKAVEFLEKLLGYSRHKLMNGNSGYADVIILTQKCLDDVKKNVNFKLAVELLLLRVVRLVSNMTSK